MTGWRGGSENGGLGYQQLRFSSLEPMKARRRNDALFSLSRALSLFLYVLLIIIMLIHFCFFQ